MKEKHDCGWDGVCGADRTGQGRAREGRGKGEGRARGERGAGGKHLVPVRFERGLRRAVPPLPCCADGVPHDEHIAQQELRLLDLEEAGDAGEQRLSQVGLQQRVQPRNVDGLHVRRRVQRVALRRPRKRRVAHVGEDGLNLGGREQRANCAKRERAGRGQRSSRLGRTKPRCWAGGSSPRWPRPS